MSDRRRAHISNKTKLAAALRELFGIPHDHAKLMTEDQVCSLAHYDHNEFHAHGGEDAHWNLTPMLIAAHREKSRGDAGVIAKVERLRRMQEAARQEHEFAMGVAHEPPRRPRFKRKIASRVNPWPKGRKIRSRPFERGG